jgi:hypothetical protein
MTTENTDPLDGEKLSSNVDGSRLTRRGDARRTIEWT